MKRKQYCFSKLDKEKYGFRKDIVQLIHSGIENLRKKNYIPALNDFTDGISLCEKLKNEAIKERDEYSANLSFLVKKYYNLLISISDFWKLCDSANYQDAWSHLQDALDVIRTLNKFIEDESQLSIDITPKSSVVSWISICYSN